VDDFMKNILRSIEFALEHPTKSHPPNKKRKLSVSEIVTLTLFQHFTGHSNIKSFYRHIRTYHGADFPHLPEYQNFVNALNDYSWLAVMMLEVFMKFLRNHDAPGISFADATKSKVCENKREFTHKVSARIAKKGKSSMGWFYGFKLHIVCNDLMQILNFRITPGNFDDRKGLEMIWNKILGTIIADAGYVGKNWQKKAQDLGKKLFTAVRANMKKLMIKAQHNLLKLRQIVETVFSVLKHRMNLETTLPRSELGYFAHYIWCITAYQIKKFFEFISSKRLHNNIPCLS
jgi:transposase